MKRFSRYSEIGSPTYKKDFRPRVMTNVFLAFDTDSEYRPQEVYIVNDIGERTACLTSLQYANDSFTAFLVLLPSYMPYGVYRITADGRDTEEFEITSSTVTLTFKNIKTYPETVPFNTITPRLRTGLIAYAVNPRCSDNLYDNTRGVSLPLSSFTWNEYSVTLGPLSDSQMTALNALHLFSDITIDADGYFDSRKVVIREISFNGREATLTLTDAEQ